ncbi:MAG: ParA family protein [Desulforudis sp.]|nr:MAG: ParA family protein [Desulforudis sp.]
MKVLAFTNEKGGVAKTTTSINIGAALAKAGKSTLLIDCDPQISLTNALRMESTKAGLAELLVGKREVKEAIYRWTPTNAWWSEKLRDLPLYIIAGSDNLGDTIESLGAQRAPERYQNLKKIIKQVGEMGFFDYVILDSPPGRSTMAENVITASDYLVIPVEPEYLTIYATKRLLSWIFKVEKASKTQQNILGFIVVKYDMRLGDHAKAIEFLKGQKTYKVYEPFIKNLSVFKNSNAEGIPAVLWRATHEGSMQYQKVAKEVMKDAERR